MRVEPLAAAGGPAVTFLVALILGMAATRAAMALARRTGFLNHPNPIIATHVAPVPYGGGAAVWVAIAATLLVRLPGAPAPPALSYVLSGLPLLLLGLVDDARPLGPVWKGILQSLAVAAGLAILPVAIGPAGLVLAFFAALAIINGLNFLDVSDGVAGGVLLGAGAVTAIAGGGALPAALAGATLGFLVFNWVPARIYLGDAGSHWLGFLLVAMALVAAERTGSTQPGETIVMLGLYGALPLVELAFVSFARLAAGRSVLQKSPDHLPLRLQRLDIPRWAIAATACLVSAASAGAAWAFARTHHYAIPAAAALLLMLGCLAVLYRDRRR